MPGERALYLAEITRAAQAMGVPPAIADAVAMVETGYQPDAVGSAGEIGLMQILPGTAAQLGFHGPITDLFNPALNIQLGVSYLARAWASSGGDLCATLNRYRAGLAATSFSARSASYCARAQAWLATPHSRLDAGDDPYVIAMAPALIRQPHGRMVIYGPTTLVVRDRPARSRDLAKMVMDSIEAQ